jgi:hypothetical protein
MCGWRGWSLLRAQPCLFLGLSALLFLALAGAGVGAVLGVSASAQADDTARASALVNSVAATFGARLQGALFPSLAASTFIGSGPPPLHASVSAWFASAAPALVASSPAIDDVQLSPYGHAAAIYPLVTKYRNMTGILTVGDWASGGGHDLFNATSVVANRREFAVLALTAQQLQVEGPKPLLSGATTCVISCAAGLKGLLSRIPLFAPTSNASEDWSRGFQWPSPVGPPLGPFTSVTGCASVLNPANNVSLCATNATGDGRRFFGFFTVIVLWSQLLQDSGVLSLGDATSGLRWSISRSSESSNGTGAFAWVNVGASNEALPATAYAGGIVSETVRAYSSAWVFTVAPRNGSWAPAWQTGALVGVVLLAALLTVLALVLALQRTLHAELLYSIVPRRVVARLAAGGEAADLAEHYEHATVLFSDLVSYTALAQGSAPGELMRMLARLFSAFDALTAARGVQKIETIGDAYLVRGGHALSR